MHAKPAGNFCVEVRKKGKTKGESRTVKEYFSSNSMARALTVLVYDAVLGRLSFKITLAHSFPAFASSFLRKKTAEFNCSLELQSSQLVSPGKHTWLFLRLKRGMLRVNGL